MKKLSITFVFLSLFILHESLAQSTENSFGIDPTQGTIICHQALIDSLTMNKNDIESLNLAGTRYQFLERHSELKTSERYEVFNANDTFQLYVTPLPIVKISTLDSIKDEPKTSAYLSYGDATLRFTSPIAIEWRGNSALKYPKKSYDLEFRTDTIGTISKDYSLHGLRDDDDWILNSVYNEPLKLRSYVATQLWLKLREESEPNDSLKGKPINDLVFAEVFLDNHYEGLYLLSEQVDRKQLKLKKIQNDTVHGELFKANSYADASNFKSAPTFNNAFPHWAGFEIKYPYEDYTAHWENLYQFIALAVADDDEKFEARIEKHLDLDNAIDYFLFVNLLRATDNLGKNYYLARRAQESPYYFVPWDLDGIMGYIQDAKRIETTGDVLSNALFDRLLATNPSNYRSRLKLRWEELRTTIYSNEALFKRITESFSFLKNNQIYFRDAQVWASASQPEAELAYLKDWLEKRLTFLDALCAGFD